jgi:DNA modification methylase
LLVGHTAAYPPELIEPCVLAGCPVGGVVLDPFAGVGTTLMVAARNGRRYIGFELDPENGKHIKANLHREGRTGH